MKLMKRDQQGYYGATKLKWLTVWELKLQHFAKNIFMYRKSRSVTTLPYYSAIFNYDLPLVLILFPQQHFLQIG